MGCQDALWAFAYTLNAHSERLARMRAADVSQPTDKATEMLPLPYAAVHRGDA